MNLHRFAMLAGAGAAAAVALPATYDPEPSWLHGGELPPPSTYRPTGWHAGGKPTDWFYYDHSGTQRASITQGTSGAFNIEVAAPDNRRVQDYERKLAFNGGDIMDARAEAELIMRQLGWL